jgi:hypothetical protein
VISLPAVKRTLTFLGQIALALSNLQGFAEKLVKVTLG